MTIRAVVFDFGGVLFDWNPQHLYRKLIADDDERQWFLENICTQAWNTSRTRVGRWPKPRTFWSINSRTTKP